MMCNPEADSSSDAGTCTCRTKDNMLSTVQEDDESPRCVVDFYDAQDGDETAAELSSSASNSIASSSSRRLHLRQLVVDLKMELAEALAKVDDLTLANQRLEQELDQVRKHVEWLRQSPSTESRPTTTPASSTTADTNSPMNRRASDGGAPMPAPASGVDEPSSPSSSSSFVRGIFQSSISSLHDEAMPTSTTIHRGSSRPDINNCFDDLLLWDDDAEEDHIETLHFTEHGQPILSARDVGRTLSIPTAGLSLRTSLRRLSNEICNTIQPLSSEAFPESSELYRHNETDRAAGLSTSRRSSMPNLRSRRTSHILAKADRLHQRQEDIRGSRPPSLSSHPPREDEDQDNAGSASREIYHEYTVKTIFGKDDTAVRRQQRRDRRRRKSLVSSLQIAQARIAGTSSSSEDDMGVDISPYLPSEGED